MGVDRLDEPQAEFLHQLEVAIDLLQDGIDDQRLAAAPAGENVAVGARRVVEQLPENHRSPRGASGVAHPNIKSSFPKPITNASLVSIRSPG